MNDTDSRDGRTRQMTVAEIRQREGSAAAEVLFLESARFYRLLHANAAYDRVLQRLQDALKKKQPVTLRLTQPHGDIIEDAQ